MCGQQSGKEKRTRPIFLFLVRPASADASFFAVTSLRLESRPRAISGSKKTAKAPSQEEEERDEPAERGCSAAAGAGAPYMEVSTTAAARGVRTLYCSVPKVRCM